LLEGLNGTTVSDLPSVISVLNLVIIPAVIWLFKRDMAQQERIDLIRKDMVELRISMAEKYAKQETLKDIHEKLNVIIERLALIEGLEKARQHHRNNGERRDG
jgi:ribosome-interacting GTPase 1